jgi:predicted dinucleotide-binding enzyme
MKVAILGTGDVGRSLGHGFADLGHDVCMGSRRGGGDSAKAFVAEHGGHASEDTFAAAAAFGELAVLAVLGTAVADVVGATAGGLDGKVVIDATNPLDFSGGFPPELAISGDNSGGEMLQRLVPSAKVVKAFNIVPNALMYQPHLEGGPPTMMIAGDDTEAKVTVTRLLGNFGWDVVDLGGIKSSRWLEAMCMAWVMAASVGGHPRSAFKLLR